MTTPNQSEVKLMTNTLETLAARCEAAQGPNYQLEQEIGAAVFPKRASAYPAYTASLDAAMQLVPDDWSAVELASRQARSAWKAEVSRLCSGEEEIAESRRCKTPALALCAAALRARAQKKDETDADS